MTALLVQDLQKSYRAPDGTMAPVIDIARFELAAGAQVALRGESGSGKTTLLHLIAGILRPDAGRVVVAGTDLTALTEPQRDLARALHIGYVFQTFNLLPGYTAVENVLLAMAFGRGADHAHARELLTRVGMQSHLHHKPRHLSVGQQQRVAVARALANRPALVLADEPTGNLDRRNADAALALIRDLCRENQAALLLVSHDDRVLAQFAEVRDLEQLNQALAPAGSHGAALAAREGRP